MIFTRDAPSRGHDLKQLSELDNQRMGWMPPRGGMT